MNTPQASAATAKHGIALVLLAGALGIQAQVVNGNFETPDNIHPYRVFSAGRSLPGWTVEKGTVEIVGGRYWQPAVGQQSLDLNGTFDDTGTIYQDVPTEAGRKYRIQFAFAGNPDGGPTMKTFRVSWDGREVSTLSFETVGLSRTNMGWRHHEFVVTAPGSTGRLRFQSLTPGFCGPTLDDVSVTSVSPATPTLAEEVSRSLFTPANTMLTATAPGSTATISTAATNAVLQIQICPVITLFGSVGHTYRIESSEDFQAAEWTTLTNLTLTSNPQWWADTQAGGASKRFYRAVPASQ